ncbi:MAG: terminase small subunit [Stellaceae bacterium]
MNERQRRFVEHYLVCRNATEAARRAGYAEMGASSNGGRMLRVPAVVEALAREGIDAAERRVQRDPRLDANAHGLTQRQQRFVEEYAALPNARRAAERAGYAPRHAGPAGAKLIRNPRVIAVLKGRGIEVVYGAFARDPDDRKRPWPKGQLTPRQERFIAEYLALGQGKEAALRAGYSKRNPTGAASFQLRHPLVAAAIAKGSAEIAGELRVDAARVIEEYARLAFADLRDYVEWGPKGAALKPQSEIAKAASPAIIEFVARKDKRGTRMKVKLHSKLKSLEALGKYLGLFQRANASPASRAAALVTSREDGAAKLRALLQRS